MNASRVTCFGFPLASDELFSALLKYLVVSSFYNQNVSWYVSRLTFASFLYNSNPKSDHSFFLVMHPRIQLPDSTGHFTSLGSSKWRSFLNNSPFLLNSIIK